MLLSDWYNGAGITTIDVKRRFYFIKSSFEGMI